LDTTKGVYLNILLILSSLIAYSIAVVAGSFSVPESSIALKPNMVKVENILSQEKDAEISKENTAFVSTEEYVRKYFSDAPIMAEVAWCESHFVHIDPLTGEAKRGHLNSQDIGVMQINEYYHRDASEKMGLTIEVLEDNLAYARYLFETEGTRPWNASRPCWGHYEQKFALK
jgi:hypothetical protein